MRKIPNLTLEETFTILGLNPKSVPICKAMAKNIYQNATEELSWRYARFDVRERSSGCPELVISVPFGIEGL